jgi:hypothetical protein
MDEITNDRKKLRPERLKYILISLILLLALYPMIERGKFSAEVLNIFFMVILIATIYVSSLSRRRLAVALGIGIPWMLAVWTDAFFHNTGTIMIAGILLTFFCGYAAFTTLTFVLSAKKVTGDMICGAVSAYLLLGLAWVGSFGLLEAYQPGSFAAGGLSHPDFVFETTDFIYYSYVTLTTLGYGDIIPLTARARSLAILEAITGVLFMAVLLARLVGTHIVHMTDSRK